MVEFYNREPELAAIERVLGSSRAELIIVFGRRGSGKSELLVRAITDYPAIYYQATTEVINQQLDDLTDELRRYAGERAVIGRLNTLGDALTAISTLAREHPQRPMIVVIDEFTYLAEADPGAETVIQKWWDAHHRRTPTLKVFLAGSHVSWMREHTLSEHGPLQNRRTGQIEITPLNYRHAAEFYPKLSPHDKINAYGIWGGLPGFLREIDPTRRIWDNVARTILDPHARLFAEPDWLRFTDLREDALYTSIIRTIAEGQHTPGDIATAVGRKSATDISDPLRRLVSFGIAERRVPLTVSPNMRARPRYELADHFLAFWYRFIDRRRSMLRRRQAVPALHEIRQEIDTYIAQHVFEGICREWVWEAIQGRILPHGLAVTDVGAWWGGTRTEQDEIDVVALDASND